MAMAISRDSALALSVSADHLVGRYDLNVSHRACMVICVHRSRCIERPNRCRSILHNRSNKTPWKRIHSNPRLWQNLCPGRVGWQVRPSLSFTPAAIIPIVHFNHGTDIHISLCASRTGYDSIRSRRSNRLEHSIIIRTEFRPYPSLETLHLRLDLPKPPPEKAEADLAWVLRRLRQREATARMMMTKTKNLATPRSKRGNGGS